MFHDKFLPFPEIEFWDTSFFHRYSMYLSCAGNLLLFSPCKRSRCIIIVPPLILIQKYGHLLSAVIRRSEGAAPGFLSHIGLARLMLLALYLQRHLAKERRCYLPPLGLEKQQWTRNKLDLPRLGKNAVRLVSDGRDKTALIAVQRGPRGSRTVGFCPVRYRYRYKYTVV